MASTGAVRTSVAPGLAQHIVAPVDGSPASRHGSTLAAEVARRTGARVTVVHVRHVPAGVNLGAGTIAASVAETLTDMEASTRAAAEEVLEGAGVAWDLVIRSGSPGEEVLKTVDELGADLVVVGSERHGSVHNALLGSTSAYLASHSPVPVLVARPPRA